MADASFTDILQDRTHKYRRMLIALCLVLVAVYWLPIRFDELQLFGIKPKANYAHTRSLVIWTLWALWLYHALLFIFYAQRDWKDWRADLRKGDVAMPQTRESFPEVRMYFPRWKRLGCRPSRFLSGKYLGDENGLWESSETGDVAVWKARNAGGELKRFRIPIDSARSVRSRVRWYVLVECSVPVILSLIALYAGVGGHLDFPRPSLLQ